MEHGGDEPQATEENIDFLSSLPFPLSTSKVYIHLTQACDFFFSSA